MKLEKATVVESTPTQEEEKVSRGLCRDIRRDLLFLVSLKELEDHFRNLLMERRPDFQNNNKDSGTFNNLEMQIRDVIKAVKELENGKAPGKHQVEFLLSSSNMGLSSSSSTSEN